jgi:hypothetical protein
MQHDNLTSFFNMHISVIICGLILLCVCKMAKSDHLLHHVCQSVGPSVCPHEQLSSQWMNFQEIWYRAFFDNMLEKFKFHSNLTRIMGTLCDVLRKFITTSQWILLNVSDKNCRENHNNFMFNKCYLKIVSFMR